MDDKKKPDSGSGWLEIPLEVSPAKLPHLGKFKKPVVIFSAASLFFIFLGVTPQLSQQTSESSISSSDIQMDVPTQAPVEIESTPSVEGGDDGPADSGVVSQSEDVKPVSESDESPAETENSQEPEVRPSPQSSNETVNSSVGSASTPSPSSAAPSPAPSSQEPRALVFPDLRGITTTEAGYIIGPLDLRYWIAGSRCSDTYDRNKIAFSEPEPGDRIDLNDWPYPNNVIKVWRSSGPCSLTAAQTSMRFDPGFTDERRFTIERISERGGKLEFILRFNGLRSEQDTLLDFGASCTVDLDFEQKVPCLNSDGNRMESVSVPSGQTREIGFFVNLNEFGRARPGKIILSYFMEAPPGGYYKQFIEVDIVSWTLG